MFSLDVRHVLQFYREVLAEPISHNNPLIFFDHLCVFMYILFSLGTMLESCYIWGTFGICWRCSEMPKQKEADGCRWKHVDFQAFLFFLPVYKIEDVDPINLEPQSSIKLRKHNVS